MKLSSKILLALLAIVIVYCGFFREYVFQNLNAWIGEMYYKENVYQLPENLYVFKRFTYDELYTLKWILTLTCMVIYMGLTLTVIKIIYRDRKYLVITVGTFFALFIIAGICYVAGNLLNNYYYGYTLSRIFMGMVQSPLVLMILVPAFQLSRGSAEKNN